VTGEFRDFQYAVDTTPVVPPTRIVAVHGTRGGAPPPAQRPRLGEALVQAEVITPAQLAHCLRVQETTVPRRRLGAVVVDLGLASDVDVARGLGTILGFEYVEPQEHDVPLDVVHRVPRLTAEMLGVVPLGAGDTWLRVAVADPTDRYTVDALREATGLLTVSMAIATPRAIDAALRRFWAPDYAPAEPEAAADPAPAAVTTEEQEAEEPVEGGWEYTFVTDRDVPGTERELTRLGALGWEAVGMTASGPWLTVLLKRSRG
jgi:hypothetical protein